MAQLPLLAAAAGLSGTARDFAAHLMNWPQEASSAAERTALLPLCLLPYNATLRFAKQRFPLRRKLWVIIPLGCWATHSSGIPRPGGEAPQYSSECLAALAVVWRTWAAALMTMRPACQRLGRRVPMTMRPARQRLGRRVPTRNANLPSRGREHSGEASRPARRCQRRRPPPPRKCRKLLARSTKRRSTHRAVPSCLFY